jgi:hypothetical protein
VLRTEPNLLTALQEGSEILRDVNDQFCPLMYRFRIYFFWEQEQTKLKHLDLDYIVTEESAAPILDNTERCGIAANHSGMCKFSSIHSQGFRDVLVALRRYCRSAPDVIATRLEQERRDTARYRQEEAAELLSLSGFDQDRSERRMVRQTWQLPEIPDRALRHVIREDSDSHMLQEKCVSRPPKAIITQEGKLLGGSTEKAGNGANNIEVVGRDDAMK